MNTLVPFFGPSEAPPSALLEPHWGLLEHVGSHLEASYAILSRLGYHLGLSEALLEPSWAILDAPTPRDTPRPGPGDGGRGEGYPPTPKGNKEWVGRGHSLDHLRPEGCWDWTSATRVSCGRRCRNPRRFRRRRSAHRRRNSRRRRCNGRCNHRIGFSSSS